MTDKPQTPYDICERLFDAYITFTKIIWLAASASHLGANSSGDFAHEFEYSWEDEDARRLIGMTYSQFQKKFDGDFDELSSHLTRKGILGFLIEAETPFPKYLGDTGIYSSGFGHTTLKWFYTDTPNDPAFLKKVEQWRDGIHKREKTKAAKEAKAESAA